MYLPSLIKIVQNYHLSRKFSMTEKTQGYLINLKKNVKGNNLSITIIIIFFVFLGPHTRHIEVPRLEVELEL